MSDLIEKVIYVIFLVAILLPLKFFNKGGKNGRKHDTKKKIL